MKLVDGREEEEEKKKTYKNGMISSEFVMQVQSRQQLPGTDPDPATLSVSNITWSLQNIELLCTPCMHAPLLLQQVLNWETDSKLGGKRGKPHLH